MTTSYEIVQEHIKQHFTKLPCSLLTCQSSVPLFSNDECDKICKLASEEILTYSKVGGTGFTRVDENANGSNVCYLHECQNTLFFYERIREFMTKTNDHFWNFELFDFGEPFKFAEYTKGKGTCVHSDIANYCITGFRKLTIVVQLSDETEYEGGELIVDAPSFATKQKGHVVIFPSFLLHKVCEITKGKRCSLVGFAYGPPLR